MAGLDRRTGHIERSRRRAQQLLHDGQGDAYRAAAESHAWDFACTAPGIDGEAIQAEQPSSLRHFDELPLIRHHHKNLQPTWRAGAAAVILGIVSDDRDICEVSMTARRGRGEGHVERLPSGKWRAVVSLGAATGGRRRKRLGPYDTKADALKALRQELSARDHGRAADAGDMTVGQWLSRWLQLKKARVEPATWRWYDCRVRRHILSAQVGGADTLFGDLPLAKLMPLQVEELHAALTARGISQNEQHKVATTLRTALKDALRMRLVSWNPALEVAKPKVARREMHCWDADQARDFLAAAHGSRLEAYWYLALDAGMRPGEMLGLHWPEVDFTAGAVRVKCSLDEVSGRIKPPKTNKGRRLIHLSRATVAALARHRERMQCEGRDVQGGLVFVGNRGKRITQSDIYNDHFTPALQRAGVPRIRPYDLRHTSATLLLAAGVNVKVVSERLGHGGIEITLKHYAHVLPSMQEQAVRAMNSIMGDCPTIVPRGPEPQKGADGAKDDKI